MKVTPVDTFLEILILLICLNKSQVLSSGSTGLLKSDQKHRTQKAAEKANELLCYICETMDVTQSFCMNVSESSSDIQQKCTDDRRICSVKKVSFQSTNENATMTHKTFSMKRSCTHRCEPGCIAIGERLKLRKCVSCCQENLCNYGNSSPTQPLTQLHKFITLFLHIVQFLIIY